MTQECKVTLTTSRSPLVTLLPAVAPDNAPVANGRNRIFIDKVRMVVFSNYK